MPYMIAISGLVPLAVARAQTWNARPGEPLSRGFAALPSFTMTPAARFNSLLTLPNAQEVCRSA
jgi:hypothetical protein